MTAAAKNAVPERTSETETRTGKWVYKEAFVSHICFPYGKDAAD